jgi:lipoate-protein ligase A
VRTHAITLAEALGVELSWRAVAEAIVAGFRQTMDIDFIEGALDLDESATAEQLASEVYSNVNWRRRRANSPALD